MVPANKGKLKQSTKWCLQIKVQSIVPYNKTNKTQMATVNEGTINHNTNGPRLPANVGTNGTLQSKHKWSK